MKKLPLRCVLGACLLAAAALTGCNNHDDACPDGWIYDAWENGGCRASSSLLTDLHSQMPQGLYGFVKTVEGGCGPGDHSCSSGFIADHVVRVYRPVDLGGDSVGPCPWDDIPAENDPARPPVTTGLSDSTGTFAVPLNPGQYCVVSIDVITSETWVKAVEVEVGDLVKVPLIYDHGGY